MLFLPLKPLASLKSKFRTASLKSLSVVRMGTVSTVMYSVVALVISLHRGCPLWGSLAAINGEVNAF